MNSRVRSLKLTHVLWSGRSSLWLICGPGPLLSVSLCLIHSNSHLGYTLTSFSGAKSLPVDTATSRLNEEKGRKISLNKMQWERKKTKNADGVLRLVWWLQQWIYWSIEKRLKQSHVQLTWKKTDSLLRQSGPSHYNLLLIPVTQAIDAEDAFKPSPYHTLFILYMQQSDTQTLLSIQLKWAYEAEFTLNQVLWQKQVWLPGEGGVPKFHKHNRTHRVTSSHGCLVCCIALVSDRQDLWLETSVCIAETAVSKKLSWAQLQAPEKSVVIVSNDRCSWTAAAGLQGVSLKMNEKCCFLVWT